MHGDTDNVLIQPLKSVLITSGVLVLREALFA